MTFEEALKAELETVTGLSGVVFPLQAQEGTPSPYVIYLSQEGLPEKTLDGFLTLRTVHLDLNIMGDTYSTMKTTTQAVIAKINGWLGTTIGSGTVKIRDITWDKVNELYEFQVLQYRCLIQMTLTIE